MFVGRVIPNKKFEDVIRAFHVYRTRHNPRSRLLLVGSYSGFETLPRDAARRSSRRLGTPDVHFLGHVSNEELTALYDVADLFLCASEHEGFCVPIIEAFYKRVPVLAYARPPCRRRWTAAACSTTRQDPLEIARLMDAVLDDGRLEDGGRRVAGRGARAPARAGTSPARCCASSTTLLRRGRRGRRRRSPGISGPSSSSSSGSKSCASSGRRCFRALPVDAGLGARRSATRRWQRGSSRRPRTDPASTRAPEPRTPSPDDDHQPVGAGGAPRRRDRRQRAARARHAARAGPRVGALRADDRRRPARATCGRSRDPAARRGDVTIFHFALPSPMTEAFAALPRRRACCSTTTSRRRAFFAPYDAGSCSGWRRSAGRSWRSLVGQRRPRARRLGVQPRRSSRRSASRRPACCRSPSTPTRITGAPRAAGAREDPRRRPDQHPLRRPHRPEQADRGSHPARRGLQALRRQLLPLHLRRPLRRRAALLRADPGADRASSRCCRIASGSPGRCPTRIWRRSTAGRTSTSRSASTRASACRSSRRWRPTCRCWPTPPARCPKRSAAPGVLFAPKDLEVRRRDCSACSYTIAPVRERVLEGQRRRLQDFAPDAHRRAAAATLLGLRITVEDRVHRPALRHRDPRRVRVSLPADRRAARADAPGRGADDLRARTTSPGRTSTRRAPTASAASPSGASPTPSTRDIDAFNRYSEWIFNNAHTRDDEMEWLRQQGPWCPALLEYLERNHQQYDVLIFFTYLYAPTVLGMRIAPQKSILVPTAHDEPAIHLEIYKELFSAPAGIAYNTDVERRFLTTHFSIRAVEEETVGCGVDLPQAHPYPRERRRPTAPHGETDRRPRTTDGRPGRRLADVPAAPRAPRLDVPAPPPAARPVPALRRAHRSGQGLRGADRVLQHLRAGGRRRVAGADGREADAAARGAVHPLRRPALGPGAPAGARSRDRRRRARRRTRACRCSRSSRSPSARRSSPTPAAKCWSTTATRATPGCTTPTATSSASACGC